MSVRHQWNAHTKTPLQTLIDARIVPLCQWFFTTRQYLATDHNQLKAGWSVLEWRYREYLATRQADDMALPMAAPRPAEWLTPVLQTECDGLLFSALTHEAALQAEGERMAHCIGGYASRCRSSTLRAYSVTDSKTRQCVATLTVAYSSASQNWQFDDMKGPENADVSNAAMSAAFGLLCCLDDATAINPQVRQELERLNRRTTWALIDGPNVELDCELPF